MLIDEKTVTEIFEDYSGDIFKYSLSLLKNNEDAKDAVQEVFVQFIKNKHSFRGECSIKTWLLVITRNYCYKRLGGKERNSLSIDDNCCKTYDPNLDMRISLKDALEKMGKEEFELIYLREYAGHSYQEIAHILNISIDNVKVRLFRVREQLRKILR